MKVSDVKKSDITKVARLRRQGATWNQVNTETGFKFNSTKYGHLLATAGYDRLGRKGGRGKSKARAYGPNLLNGKAAK